MSNLIEVQNLKFSYPNKWTVLDIQNFSIPQGKTIFIHGPSGSGKSTFLEILSGILVGQSGVVKILENDLVKMNSVQRDRLRADHIGYIFQSFNLIPYLSVEENIMLPIQLSSLKAEKSKQQNMEQLMDRLGIHSLRQQSAKELSVGQQQRVAVARALLGQPEIILADEPTSALDYNHREKFLQLLFENAKVARSTVIFVSHDRTMEKLFDEVYSFSDLNGVKNALS